MTDEDVISIVDAAFADCSRPEHFTDHEHCSECVEHDDLLRGRDRDTLQVEDVENPGWDPLCFATDEGFKYYIPALVRLALAQPKSSGAWYFPQFLFHLTYSDGDVRRLSCCSSPQRDALATFLRHVQDSRKTLIEGYRCDEELHDAIAVWGFRRE